MDVQKCLKERFRRMGVNLLKQERQDMVDLVSPSDPSDKTTFLIMKMYLWHFNKPLIRRIK